MAITIRPLVATTVRKRRGVSVSRVVCFPYLAAVRLTGLEIGAAMMSTFDRYADTVHQLIRFAGVREFFQWHISRWRKKKSLIQANEEKAESALKRSAKRKKVPAEWPYHRVGVGGSIRLVQVPPELLQKVEKRESLMEGSLLTRLTRMPFKELTPSEQFTLLAQIHDACYAKNHLGPTDLRAYERGKGHYLSSVGVLESDLGEGRKLTKIEHSRLHDVLAFVLARIEAKVDPATNDDKDELLADVVGRLRRKWNLHSSRTVVSAPPTKTAEAPDGGASSTAVVRLARESVNELAESISSRVKRPTKQRPTTRQAAKSKAEQQREDKKRGDEWLRGRNNGQYLTYNDMALAKGLELWDLAASIDRDRHHRVDVWAANKKPRRKKAVKTR